MKVGQKEFTRTKYSALDGQTVIRYQEPDEFHLEARPYGLTITGNFVLETETQLQEFAKLLSEAWQDRRNLKPKLYNSVSGH